VNPHRFAHLRQQGPSHRSMRETARFRILNFCATLLTVSSLLLLSVGIVGGISLAYARPSEGLWPKEPIKSVGLVRAGTRVEVMIALENHSRKVIRILGASRACYPQCCITAEDLPMSVPGLGEGIVTLRLAARSNGQGDFRLPVTIYTDFDGRPEVDVEVRGRVLSPNSGSPDAR